MKIKGSFEIAVQLSSFTDGENEMSLSEGEGLLKVAQQG